MSSQQLDLRRSASLIRRRKRIVAAAVGLGIAVGAVFAVLSPPMMTAKALVVLPGARPNAPTEVVVASSNPVLQGALPYVTPSMTLTELRDEVQVSSLSDNILQISAMGRTAEQAEANATAVANSYISYIGSTSSPVGRLNVRVLQAANSATGTSPIERWAMSCLAGGLGGVLVGVIAALAIGRRDRKLRTRDDIANSIGMPVLASLPVAHPSSAGEWRQVLTSYQPRPVYAWRLRKTLQQLTLAGVNPAGAKPSSVTVLSLATDPKALALGPQLAAYAASQGIDTCVVVGQGQDAKVTATLRTACASMPDSGPNLRVMIADSDDTEAPDDAGLTVVVATLDSRDPRVAGAMHTSATIIGVSAGGATADQLALAAVTVAADGREIAGILIADPDPEDHTTGRIPQFVRPSRNGMAPVHVTSPTTEVRR